MRADELFKIGHKDVEKGLEFKQKVKPNYIPDFQKPKMSINQNIGVNKQSFSKIPAQESSMDKIKKGLEKIPWKNLIIWTAIGGCIYLLWKIPPKDNSRRKRIISNRIRP